MAILAGGGEEAGGHAPQRSTVAPPLAGEHENTRTEEEFGFRYFFAVLPSTHTASLIESDTWAEPRRTKGPKPTYRPKYESEYYNT